MYTMYTHYRRQIFLLTPYLCILLGLSSHTKTSEQNQQNTQKFSQETLYTTNTPPAEILSVLNERTNIQPFEIIHTQTKTNDRTYIVKDGNISRLINAHRLKKLFDQHKLDLLSVPKKYLLKTDTTQRIIAEYITTPKKFIRMAITIKEYEQLKQIAVLTGYKDWWENLIRNEKGQLTFIDTEDRSFNDSRHDVIINHLNTSLLQFFPVDPELQKQLSKRQKYEQKAVTSIIHQSHLDTL